MSGNRSVEEAALYTWWCSWQVGAGGGVLAPSRATDPHAVDGYERGRKARKEAYAWACRDHGVVLSPLREG